MATPDYVGRVDGVELEAWRLAAAKKDALELNPRAFSKDESIEICKSFYEAMEAIIQRHPEWELPEFVQFNVSPDSGCVYGMQEYS